MDMQLEQQAHDTIARYGMLPPGSTVIAALSGGADSMALTSFLYRFQNFYHIHLCAAHVNHGLREEEADRDEAFVRKICGQWGIELHVLHADVRKEAEQTGESEEECGRRLRYAFFESIDPEAWIATAHTQTDNAETVLLNLARGTALRGLCGIPPVNGRRIRPLIDCSREQVERYCVQQNIDFVTDHSNFSDAYTRNRIRLQVVPVLRQINPGFGAAVSRCVDTLREEDALLSELAREAVRRSERENGYCAISLFHEKRPVRRRALHLILSHQTQRMIEAGHLDAVERLLGSGGKTQVAGGVTVRVRRGILEFPGLLSAYQPWEIPANITDTELPNGLGTLSFSYVHKKDGTDTQKINKLMLANALDCDKIVGNVLVRSRLEGDYFHPVGRNGGKSLKKLFQEAGIAPEKRNQPVVLSDEQGILFVEGFGVDRRAAVTEKTQRILWMKIVH